MLYHYLSPLWMYNKCIYDDLSPFVQEMIDLYKSRRSSSGGRWSQVDYFYHFTTLDSLWTPSGLIVCEITEVCVMRLPPLIKSFLDLSKYLLCKPVSWWLLVFCQTCVFSRSWDLKCNLWGVFVWVLCGFFLWNIEMTLYYILSVRKK